MTCMHIYHCGNYTVEVTIPLSSRVLLAVVSCEYCTCSGYNDQQMPI